MNIPKGSRAYAWYIGIATTVLVSFAISKGMEGAASAIFTAGMGGSAGLYANKQYNERKHVEAEIKKK